MSFRAILAKDLRVEWRRRDTLAATLTVALLIALAGDIAYAERLEARDAVAGVLWTGIIFGAQVGLARSFVVERERGTLSGFLTTPAPSLAFFGAKLAANLLVLGLVALVTLVALVGFFHLGASDLTAGHLGIIALGALGVGLVTTLAAAIAMHGRSWILLVPLLALPALFPILAAAVSATAALLAGHPVSAVTPHLRILLATDLAYAALAWLLVPYLLEP